MRISLLKAYKGFFTSRGVIILENRKKLIEGKREANNQVFLIVRIISADFSLYIVNDFGFLVVIKPSYSPFWNFVFGLPASRNICWIKATYICKFFDCQFALFKFAFKFFKSHLLPFYKFSISKILPKKFNKIKINNLTYYLENLIIFDKEFRNSK